MESDNNQPVIENQQEIMPAAIIEEKRIEQEPSEAAVSDPAPEKTGYSERTVLKGKNKPAKEPRSKAFMIMAAALVACICFSAFQTIYIFGLTTGKKGNMTYMNGRDTSPRTNVSDASNLASELADPAFTLEQAASVYDPDKKTLSTIEIVNTVSPATVSVYVVSSLGGTEQAVASGSGFIISEEGYVVTNAHVVEAVREKKDYKLKVLVPDYETPIDAELIGADDQTDVAVLKLLADEDYPYVTLGDSNLLQTGELVVAIGNPLGTLSGTVTTGVVSALGRTMNNNGYSLTLIQTDASINTGNSGGPLINSFGEVIGITNAKMSSAEGLGFAIPISDVRDIIQSLINYGYVVGRSYFGVSVQAVTDGSFFGAVEGVYVAAIDADSPAEDAGLEVGDRIISMDGIEITSTNDIIDIRNSHEIGDKIPMVVERNDKEIELSIEVADSSINK